MSVSHQDVDHVARLARLRLAAGEQERYARQLSTILEHIGKISDLDLEEVKPTSHVLPLANVFREDRVKASLSQEEVLANGPEVEAGAFKVPPILEADE